MPTRVSHFGIVSTDPDRLAEFYITVFGCERSGPPRNLHGAAIQRGMGLPGAHVEGVQLTLPAQGEDGATLEIFKLPTIEPSERGVNRAGFMHLAFKVDDVHETFQQVIDAGGQVLGQITPVPVVGVGEVKFVYTRDPDGNVVELQEWQ